MAVAVPSDLKLTIGDIDRKVDMSLDDIIKLSKQKKQRRPQVKNGINQRATSEQKRDVLQKTISSRSSVIRQAKLAELRSRNDDFKFAATKAAAQRALSTATAVPLMKRWIRKPLPPVPRPFRPAAQNFKVSVPSRMNKPVTNRRPVAAGSWMVGPARFRPVPQGQPWTLNKVGNFSGRRPQTLDSRFASLREERQFQSQFRPPAQWRR